MSEGAMAAMMANPGLTVVYASASLLLGREIIFKEAQLVSGIFRRLAGKLELADGGSGKVYSSLDADALAELFESQRLEFRVHHDATTVSRTQVIAPNPATARGWTGWVFLDEFGFIRDFRDLWEAVEPIVSTDKSFHLVMATTPPRDDSHYSYELTAPPMGMEFKVRARGNWYESEARVPVHRVDVFDAAAAGVKLYDLRTGKELTPEEHFAKADDKDAWRRNYKVEHVAGGSAACGLLALETAQRRGIGQAACVVVDSDLDFERALAWLAKSLGTGRVGIGCDIATTTKESSNPTALTVLEEAGLDYVERLVLVWKTKDPGVATERIRRVVDGVAARAEGGRARRLAIDATSERYFAEALKADLASRIPVDLVVQSKSVKVIGMDDFLSFKTRLGDLYVGALEDNHLTLPPERYLRDDHRLVKKDRGSYVCEPEADGKHGDTFDSGKLSLHALTSSSGALTTLDGVRTGSNPGRHFTPRAKH